MRLPFIAAIAVSSALLTPAHAQTDSEVLAGQVDTLVEALACQKEFGAAWDDIVAIGYQGVDDAILDLEEPLAKHEIDTLYAELQAEADATEMTDDLRAECTRISSYGG
jgi:hypothetical protein